MTDKRLVHQIETNDHGDPYFRCGAAMESGVRSSDIKEDINCPKCQGKKWWRRSHD